MFWTILKTTLLPVDGHEWDETVNGSRKKEDTTVVKTLTHTMRVISGSQEV